MARYEEISFDNTELDFNFHSKALTLGSKWFINEELTLAGELSLNDGELGVPVFDKVHDAREDGRWNVFLLQLTYQF